MDSVKTENLYEDLHWIILIAGYVLSDEVSGEKSLVPDEIMMYSIAESENVHLDSTVKYLTSLGTADIGKARRFCSCERQKKQFDWLATKADVITTQSHSLFACSR